jgi:hypothetical protein
MSKFSEFSRLFWEPVRRRRRPRLHPAMRERMWKPGQSGNPSGVSRAYAEAMRERSLKPIEVSPGAERTRRWRLRKQRSHLIVGVDVPPQLTEKLIRLGRLDAAKRSDRKAIATALVEAVEGANERATNPG